MDQVRASVRIRGRVQGVCFRQFTRETALSLQITGWVRNLPGGDVEAVFEGSEPAVRDILSWCEKGPDSARVDKLQISLEEPTGEFSGFRIR